MSVIKFIIAGSMKSGTTTLNDYLELNNQISMCHPKEPQFFSQHYDKGIKYYESLWKKPDKICGEASTCYSRWPFYKDIPAKIAAYNPHMKFIFILRNPIDRAYSHYRHNVLQDNLKYSSFNDAINKSNEILHTSLYMQQIEQYLIYFPKEQILIVDFDDLTQQPLQLINTVEQFIGVTQSTEIKSNKSNQAGIAVSKRNIRNLIAKIRHFPGINFLVNKIFDKNQRQLIRTKIEQYLSQATWIKKYAKIKSNQFPPLKITERHYFLIKLLSDIEKLEKFSQLDFSKWKT